MFKDYKTTKSFVNIMTELEEKKGKMFSAMVTEKFDEKSVSEEQLSDYKITIKDLEEILLSIN